LPEGLAFVRKRSGLLDAVTLGVMYHAMQLLCQPTREIRSRSDPETAPCNAAGDGVCVTAMGYTKQIEAEARAAARKAADGVRQNWLAELSLLRTLLRVRRAKGVLSDGEWSALVDLSREIKRLRRVLGERTTPEERREQTRLRVRRWREQHSADS
jgi:hypothetical protein